MNCASRWLDIARRALFVALLASTPLLSFAAGLTLDTALVIDGPVGRSNEVRLPDEAEGTSSTSPVARRYRWTFNLGDTTPQGLALYWRGLIGHARVSVNGTVLVDHGGPDAEHQPPPRSADRVVLLEVPDALWNAGSNRVELELRAAGYISVSALQVGPAQELGTQRRNRLIVEVIWPCAAAAIVGTVGLMALVMWTHLKQDLYAYFSVAAIGWAFHTVWTALPWDGLPPAHRVVWWTTLYAFFVGMLVIFCLRFAGDRRVRMEQAIWIFTVSSPAVLYAALAAGVLGLATTAWRLALIGFVTIGVAAMLRAMTRMPSADNVWIALFGSIALLVGAHDWIVRTFGDDNNPVFWISFGGPPFAFLVARMLIRRYVGATRDLEALTANLEKRVEGQSADLRIAVANMRLARDEAESASRTKTSFMAAAGHDLRQPAHALGFYMAALRAEPLAPEAADLVERMGRSLSALDGMFDALLDVARIDAGTFAPTMQSFSLEPMLRRLADEFAPMAEARGLRLNLRLPQTEPRVMSDPLLLNRILRNLLSNAVKYTRHGGVLLSCRRRTVSAVAPNAAWRIEIWDTGSGIAESEQARIFDEFYRIRDAGADRAPGLGLGLSIVGRLATLLDAGLDLRSTAGRGSRFGLEIVEHAGQSRGGPAETHALPIDSNTSNVPDSDLRGMWVVVMDDDSEIRDAMARTLIQWGGRPLVGSCAADFAECPRHVGTSMALIVDCRLGAGRDGLAEARSLLRRWRVDVPLLVVTAESSLEGLGTLRARGYEVMIKPLDPQCLRSWLMRASPPTRGEVS